MKTLIVFSTLTALAVAIPTLTGKHLEESRFIQDKTTSKRNTESFDSELKNPSLGFDSETNDNQERTFLKKKLLLKKLRKFRETEEEAKPQTLEENTMKSEGTQCNDQRNHEWALADLDQAVKVVTEAIERLRGIIKKQEEEKKLSESKTGKTRNAENESEGELNETVKIAKEALEKIQSDFVNLEDLHFRTTSSTNSKSAQEPLKEEERLAQWKEALENIQKNVEIARNIEDNFKSDGRFSEPVFARSDVMDQKFIKHSESNNNVQAAGKDNKMNPGKHSQDEKSSWHHDELKTDMKAAVDGAVESAPIENEEHKHIKACSVQDKHKHHKDTTPTQNTANNNEEKSNQPSKDKSDEDKSESSSQESEKIGQQMSNNKEMQLKEEEKNKKESSVGKENKPMEEMGPHKTKSDSESEMGEKKEDDDMKKVESDTNVAASNQIAHILKPDSIQNSNIAMAAKPENNQPSGSQMTSMASQMGQSRFSHQESMPSNDKLHESHAHTEHGHDLMSLMKASDEHNQRFHSMKQNIHHDDSLSSRGMLPQGRSAEMANAMWDSMPDMRSAPIHNRWQELHRSRGAYGPGLGYGTPPPSSGSASSGSASTSSSSGSGAVGVFPNAKIGDCGIPLLLSCSPSVVSGTLSKTSSYSAPAYRSESKHFNFHNKRETKKSNGYPSHVKKVSTRILESLH